MFFMIVLYLIMFTNILIAVIRMFGKSVSKNEKVQSFFIILGFLLLTFCVTALINQLNISLTPLA